jgi:hypothetical protein
MIICSGRVATVRTSAPRSSSQERQDLLLRVLREGLQPAADRVDPGQPLDGVVEVGVACRRVAVLQVQQEPGGVVDGLLLEEHVAPGLGERVLQGDGRRDDAQPRLTVLVGGAQQGPVDQALDQAVCLRPRQPELLPHRDDERLRRPAGLGQGNAVRLLGALVEPQGGHGAALPRRQAGVTAAGGRPRPAAARARHGHTAGMSPPSARDRLFRVALGLSAPGDVPGSARAEVVRLLQGTPGSWSHVEAEPAAQGLTVCVVVSGRDAADAVAAVVDGVRALAGIDATFARWVVDSRHPQVVELKV